MEYFGSVLLNKSFVFDVVATATVIIFSKVTCLWMKILPLFFSCKLLNIIKFAQ